MQEMTRYSTMKVAFPPVLDFAGKAMIAPGYVVEASAPAPLSCTAVYHLGSDTNDTTSRSSARIASLLALRVAAFAEVVGSCVDDESALWIPSTPSPHETLMSPNSTNRIGRGRDLHQERSARQST